jgi:hypothetical protein
MYQKLRKLQCDSIISATSREGIDWIRAKRYVVIQGTPRVY